MSEGINSFGEYDQLHGESVATTGPVKPEVCLTPATDDTLKEGPLCDVQDTDPLVNIGHKQDETVSETVDTTPAQPVKVIDPGVTFVKRGGQKRKRISKRTAARHRSQFAAKRQKAEELETAEVSPEALQESYRTHLKQTGRAPSKDEVLREFRTARAANKAARLIGDIEQFGKEVEEDKAWDDYYASQNSENADDSLLAAIPHISEEVAGVYEKRPVDWTRHDMVAVYCDVSRQYGHWLSSGELEKLCKQGIIPASHKTIMRVFSTTEALTAEAQQLAIWANAVAERQGLQAADTGGDKPVVFAATETPSMTQADSTVIEEESQHLEAAETDGRAEIYRRILDGRKFPKIKPERGRRMTLHIEGDDSIRINDHSIQIDGDEIYALNALLLTRDMSDLQTLARFGFDPHAELSQLTAAIKRLNRLLKDATGDELIGMAGRGKSSLYIMDPNLVVADGRQVKKILSGKAVHSPEPSSRETDNEAQYDEALFESDSEREATINGLVKKYYDDKRVIAKVHAFKSHEKPFTATSNELVDYFNYVGQFPLLDEDEERALFGFIEKGLATYQGLTSPDITSPIEEEDLINLVTAQQLIYLSNLRLAASVAKPFARHGDYNMLPLMDCIQEANAGLSKAICRFDVGLGYKFSTYATWWTRQQVQRALADKGRLIRMPVHAHAAWVGLMRDINSLTTTLEREPTEAEISRYTHIPIKKLRLLRRAGATHLHSLEKPLFTSNSGEESMSLADILPDREHTTDRFTEILSAEVEVRRLFASPQLTAREKLILGLRFGTFSTLPTNLRVERPTGRRIDYVKRIGRIATTDGLTLDKIGTILGITRERVRQVEKDALKKARAVLEAARS
ncbi:MAG TPA: sigma-70 family RNA polymerase sigma factor [Candidatus Saccharimonadales bacterium]|nr:sigma-70 family RNA polymerase sigma factor [Candidatus Saccharimonadales bacterium]